EQLADRGPRPEPDHGRAEVRDAESVVCEQPGGDRDDREGDRVEREEPQRPAEFLLIAEGLVDALVGRRYLLGHGFPSLSICGPCLRVLPEYALEVCVPE